MQLDPEELDPVIKRLRRAQGQLAAVIRMIEEGRECRDIVTQLSAANRALEQAGFRLVAAGLTYCVEDPERAAEQGYPLAEVEKMFMKLA